MNTIEGQASTSTPTSTIPTINFNEFENNNNINASKDFLSSNSFVAKVSFLILVIFVFIILLRLGISILNYIFSWNHNPILIDGMVDGENLLIRKQDPNSQDSMPIFRSVNQRDGLEFTWSVWLFIRTPTLDSTNSNQYRHVFSKGNDTIDSIGIVTPNNAPGLYISPNYRELMVVMNTFQNMREKIIIGDIPIEKWINVMIRVDQRQLDVFINGTLTRSKTLSSLPRQNYDDVLIALNGGFRGNISSLRYFATAIGTNQIQNLIEQGPNLTFIGDTVNKAKPYYLSFRWFYPQQTSIPL
jgi:hypothetical protein